MAMEPGRTQEADEFLEVSGGTLEVLSPDTGSPLGPAIPVGPEPLIVGRGRQCHLPLDDTRVSTAHCELVATAKGVRLTDLGSTNGTYVQMLRLEARSSVYLTGDSRLRCGRTSLVFRSAGTGRVALSTAGTFGPLVGSSTIMRRLYAQLARLAPHDLSVLVCGETGTGKELVARAIHAMSPRQAAPFVTLDCTTIPASLAESRLFGHERGAFTGAVTRHPSPFVVAAGGTIFFDELGELPLEIQPKLLRALEAREIQPIGSTRTQPIDVRVVAATRRNMHGEVNAKRFRDDLYFRFAQVVIELPPLREHVEDIPAIAARLLADMGDADAIRRIDKATMARLQRHDWPGNVRELRNVLLTAHAQSDGGPLDVSDLLSSRSDRLAMAGGPAAEQPFPVRKREILDAFEREYFGQLHRDTAGNVSEIARRSGLSRPTVRDYLERHGLRSTE